MKCKIYFHLKRGFWTTEQKSSFFSPCATWNPSDVGPWIGTALLLGKWQFQLLCWRHLCVTWLLMHWHQQPQSSLMLVGLFLIIHFHKITIEPFEQWASAASSPCGCRWWSFEPLSSQQSFIFRTDQDCEMLYNYSVWITIYPNWKRNILYFLWYCCFSWLLSFNNVTGTEREEKKHTCSSSDSRAHSSILKHLLPAAWMLFPEHEDWTANKSAW